jgi:hypothetical protein
MLKIFLVAILLLPVFANAGGASDYQAGLDFTQDPTGGTTGGHNAANLQNMIQLFLHNKDLNQSTDANANNKLNTGSTSAQDVNILRQYLQQSNDPNSTASTSLNEAGGRGDQKKQYCLDYTDSTKTPHPDPVKYAECQGVNELNKHPVRDWVASSGFSKNDAIFSAGSGVGLAKKGIADSPQNQLMALVGVGGGGGASGQQCVTVNKVSPPKTTTGQCTRAAIPDSIPCGVTITPKVFLEKYCNAGGGPFTVESFISGSDGSTAVVQAVLFSSTPADTGPSLIKTEPFFSAHSNYLKIEYTCGTPSLIDGSVTTIIAKLSVPSGTYPRDGGPVIMEFTPGTSHSRVQGSLGSYWWESCVVGGYGCNGNVVSWVYGLFYDGLSDTVNAFYFGAVRDNATSGTGANPLISCAPGTNFFPAGATYTTTVCTQMNYFGECESTGTQTNYAISSRCETPGKASLIEVVPVVTTASPISTFSCSDNGCSTGYVCPTGYAYYAPTSVLGVAEEISYYSTCHKISASCPLVADDNYVMGGPIVTFDWHTGKLVVSNAYCTLQSAIDNLYLYVPVPHYTGNAGVRERLVDSAIDTCASLQAQASPGPAAAGGSYPPVTVTKDTCPTNWSLIPGSATFPSICQFQPASVPALATATYVCPNGGAYNTTTAQCEYQQSSYPAIGSKLYSCAAGDTLQGACPNGGTASGQACLYKPYSANIANRSCLTGFTLVGNLCYNNPLLAQSILVANGTSVLNSINTFACNGADILNGTMCESAAQIVMCDHQSPSVSSNAISHYSCPIGNMAGSYNLNYAIADNTVQLQACVAFPITKTASPQSRYCDAPYGYNAATDKCEYQMPDYAGSQVNDCSGSPGFTYDAASHACYQVPAPYPANLSYISYCPDGYSVMDNAYCEDDYGNTADLIAAYITSQCNAGDTYNAVANTCQPPTLYATPTTHYFCVDKDGLGATDSLINSTTCRPQLLTYIGEQLWNCPVVIGDPNPIVAGMPWSLNGSLQPASNYSVTGPYGTSITSSMKWVGGTTCSYQPPSVDGIYSYTTHNCTDPTYVLDASGMFCIPPKQAVASALSNTLACLSNDALNGATCNPALQVYSPSVQVSYTCDPALPIGTTLDSVLHLCKPPVQTQSPTPVSSIVCGSNAALNTTTGRCDYVSIPALNIGGHYTCPPLYSQVDGWCIPSPQWAYSATWNLNTYACPEGGTLGLTTTGQQNGLCYLP